MKKVMFHEIDIGKHPGFVYNKEANLRAIIAALMTFGIDVWDSSLKIKNYKQFCKTCDRVFAGKHKDKDVLPFVKEHITDLIKTIICFENCQKAFILSKKYIVHVVNKQMFPELHERQYKGEPIHFSEIITESNYYRKNDMPAFKGITKHTITFSAMFKKGSKYAKLTDCPDEVSEILSAINDERNELHFYLKAGLTFGEELRRAAILSGQVEQFRRILKEFAEDDTKLSLFTLDTPLPKKP
jgi:hypothetical protein